MNPLSAPNQMKGPGPTRFANPPSPWGEKRQDEALLRSLCGEALDALSLPTPSCPCRDWSDGVAGAAWSGAGVTDPPTRAIRRYLRLDEASRRIVELSVEVERLGARCEKQGPFFRMEGRAVPCAPRLPPRSRVALMVGSGRGLRGFPARASYAICARGIVLEQRGLSRARGLRTACAEVYFRAFRLSRARELRSYRPRVLGGDPDPAPPGQTQSEKLRPMTPPGSR
jgi:hypothetical protein